MVRGFWTVMAAGLVLAVTALSMCMNFEFGYGLGTSEGTGLMLGGLSVAFDGLKALLPLLHRLAVARPALGAGGGRRGVVRARRKLWHGLRARLCLAEP